jgi:hypothetical protein
MLYALDQHGGLVWRLELDAPIRSAVALLAPGVLGIGLEDGSLAAVRCSSQSLSTAGWPKLARAAGNNALVSDNS